MRQHLVATLLWGQMKQQTCHRAVRCILVLSSNICCLSSSYDFSGGSLSNAYTMFRINCSICCVELLVTCR